MKKEEQKQRLALTLLFSTFVFLIMCLAIVIAIGIIYILLAFGVIYSVDENIKVGQAILFMSIISSIIGFVLSFLSSKVSLKPVNRFITAMNRLAAGDFKARIYFGRPIDTHPTFVEIADSFNKTAAELEHTEMLRSDFINNFSHEFKTPIVSIAGFAKILKKGNITEEQRQEYLSIIEEESLRLSYMATNVLNLTKIENQMILTDVTQYNLSEQIRSAILLLEDKWSRKKLEFHIDFAEYMITANEELMKQVWINLIDNAIKFSDDYNAIEIYIIEKDSDLQVSITNIGETIPKEKQERIFNKFYQADESHATEGNGIGLAIVKKVVELHQGTVSVQSLNEHTTFVVELPKNRIENLY